MKRSLIILVFVLPMIFFICILSLIFNGQDNSGVTPFSTSASAFDTGNISSSKFQEPCYRGDANGDLEITIADVVYIINYLFKSGDPPEPLANGDVDCVKGVTITDAVYLVNYQFKSGDAPCIPPEIFEVAVTSPHQANGIDSAEVTIIFTDSCGNNAKPADFPAESFFDVYLYIGEHREGGDPPSSFPVTDNGDGTFVSRVPSTVAGEGVIAVEIVSLNLVSLSPIPVTFEPGPVTGLTIVNVEQPREAIPRHTGRIVAIGEDSFGNPVHPPDANCIFETDFGVVDSVTVDESGDFIGWVSSWIPGLADVTVTEEYTGLYGVVELVYPAVHLFPPVRSDTEGDSTEMWETPTGYLDIGLNVWNPHMAHLGYYDLLISFDPTMVSFMGADDWDTTDGFGPPNVQILEPGNLRIWQSGWGENSNDLARLIFQPTVENAATPVIIDLWNKDPLSLIAFDGELFFPVYTLEEWWIYSELEYYEIEEDSTKPPKWVSIKLWVAPGADWRSLSNQISKAFEIFRSHAKKCCPMIYEHVLFNYLPDSTWDSLTGPNDSLDTRAERDSARARCNKPGYVDVIGAPDDALPGWSGVAVEGDAVIVDADASATGTTMAHELGHYWGLDDLNNKDNLMHGVKNKDKGKKECAGLSAEQCSTITANADP
ncbi:MAG: dockerin type I repeat-containing protein [Candidatus Zixiibacteriota bacterium]